MSTQNTYIATRSTVAVILCVYAEHVHCNTVHCSCDTVCVAKIDTDYVSTFSTAAVLTFLRCLHVGHLFQFYSVHFANLTLADASGPLFEQHQSFLCRRQLVHHQCVQFYIVYFLVTTSVERCFSTVQYSLQGCNILLSFLFFRASHGSCCQAFVC